MDSITVTRLPVAVTGLVAQAGKEQVTLSWDAVAGAISYNLYWATSKDVSPSKGTKIAAVSSPFTHTGLSNDASHYYTVTAVIGEFEGLPSNVAWATPGWTTEVVAETQAATENRDTSIAADSTGAAHIHYSFDERIGTTTVRDFHYYATNSLGPWSPELLAQPSSVSTAIALDSGDNVHVGYMSFGLKHAVRTTGTWSIEAVDSTGDCEASLALDSVGKVHFAYLSSAAGGTLRYATNASGSWVYSDIETLANKGCGPLKTVSVGVDAAGASHIAYGGASPNYGLRYATNRGGTWTVATLDSSVVEQVSLAVDLNSKVHIAFSNNLFQIKYAQDTTGAWVIETFGGSQPALALDAAGKAHVTYRGSNGLTYSTNAGGSWRNIFVDDANVRFANTTNTAIALDPAGKAHISYLHGLEVKYATNK